MDWDIVIEINRKVLLRFVAALFEMIGCRETVARFVHREVLSTLLLAEAATRRLIAIAAIGLVVEPRAKRGAPTGAIPKGSGKRVPPFALFDPRRYAGPPKQQKTPGFRPNIRGFDEFDIAPPRRNVASPDDPVSVVRLRQRLEALRAALEDIPAQAKRLARKLAAMERPVQPMRPGRPPGYNARGKRPIDIVLADCQELALMALAEVPP